MIETLRLATVAGDPEEEARLAAKLSDHQGVELFMRCMDRVEVLAAIRARALDAMVFVGLPAWTDLQVVTEAAEHQVRLVGVPSLPLDADRITQFGMTLVEGVPDLPGLLASCRAEFEGPPPLSPEAGPEGRMVALWGPKGAPGRSSIAIELAYSFERSGKNTILIDADPYGGDLLQLLGVIDESPTIVWASRLAAKGELKETALARGLRRAGMEGPVLLPGLSRPELRRDVSDFGWQRALGILRGHFETTVVDVGFDLEEALEESPLNEGGRNRLTLSVLREADSVVAICRGDPVGIKQFIRAYDRLVSIVSAERVKLVVNRVAPGHEAEIGRLLKAGVGKKPVAYLPDRPDDLFQAALKGRSVAETKPRSSLLGEVDRLAAALGAPVKAQGVLLKLGGRS